MATLRKGRCYRSIVRPYTRKSKFKIKGFIKAVPPSKITRFQMGDSKKQFAKTVKLVSKEDFQFRHNSLESCRQIINRNLMEKIGLKGYFFQVNVYPHHVLRENRMLAGAHADRLQTGMSHAFGTTVGIAAQVKKGRSIFTVRVDEKDIENAKASLLKALPRMTGKGRLIVE